MVSFSWSWQKTTTSAPESAKWLKQVSRIGADAPVADRPGVEPYPHVPSRSRGSKATANTYTPPLRE